MTNTFKQPYLCGAILTLHRYSISKAFIDLFDNPLPYVALKHLQKHVINLSDLPF